MGVEWVTLLVWTRINCWHTHTDLDKVTDAGLKAFSAALGSSTAITTVTLRSKSEMGFGVVCMRVFFGRCVNVVVCGMFV